MIVFGMVHLKVPECVFCVILATGIQKLLLDCRRVIVEDTALHPCRMLQSVVFILHFTNSLCLGFSLNPNQSYSPQ